MQDLRVKRASILNAKVTWHNISYKYPRIEADVLEYHFCDKKEREDI